MRGLFFLSAVCFGWAVLAPPVAATVQGDMLCIDPDLEFPVPCDDDED